MEDAMLSNKGANGTNSGKGRRKIAMRKIGDKKSLQVAFSKRRKSLFKKAEELSILCGVDVAVVAFSPAGKPFTFGDVGSAIDRYLPTLRDDDDHKEKETENRVVVDHGLLSPDGGLKELPSNTTTTTMGGDDREDQFDHQALLRKLREEGAMMGDDEVEQMLESLEEDGEWADSCFAA